MAASVKSCLTAGHVVCVADPPARTASERAAAEESDTKGTVEASTEVRQTGRPGSSLSCGTGILLFLALYQNKFNTINFIVEKVEFAQFPSHFGRRNS